MSVDQHLIEADREARVRALETDSSFIVQAPAGSGKTELLIQRYLKLLAIVSAPEEILAITFTRKAAAEMQNRVVQALQAAIDGHVPEAEHEQITAQAASNALARDRELGWNLTENPRRMRIQTLDALNGSIARAVPLTAGGGAADASIQSDTEMRSMYREAAALTLDQLVEDGDLADATREVLLHVDNNAAIYIAYLARMLATRDQWLPFVGSGRVATDESAQLRARLEQGLTRAVGQHLEQLVASCPQVHARELVSLGGYAGDNLRAAGESRSAITGLAELDRLPGATIEDIPGWAGFAEMLLTSDGSYRKRLTKAQGFPPGDDGQKAALGELLESLADASEFAAALHAVRSLPPVEYSAEQWRVLLALFHLLPLAVTELKRLFAERSIADHIEVALAASGALWSAAGPGDVALLLDYQVRHLLVDEMQDTSSAQYRMLEALTAGWELDDGRTLYCVGDPMQSIYRFRNAEVGQFLLSQHAGIGDIPLETLILRRNFRSGQGLVEWFNRVFPSVFPDHDDAQRSAVSYSAAASVPQRAGQGECRVHPVLGTDADQEARTGAEVIRSVLLDNPKDDVAILVRSRSHLPELLYRLRKLGISYQAVEIDRLTDLPEIIDVLALTRALAHRCDRHAWLALLRSPWVGLDWSDLHALVRNDRDTTVWELLDDAVRLTALSSRGRRAVTSFCDTLRPALESCRTETLRERVERAWIQLGGPLIVDNAEAIDNIYHFLDVLERTEEAGDLADVSELESILDTEHVSSHGDARLQVMTMHRAKGLQFDHVMLYGLGRVPRSPEPEVMSWFDLPDEHGRPLKVISPVGPRAELEKDPVHAFIARVESDKNRYELCRLLYVACTRARMSLHLVGNARLYKSGMRPDKRSLLHLLWPAVCADFDKLHEPGDGHDDSAADSGWLLPELRRFEDDLTLPDAPRLPIERPATDGAPGSVEFYWVGSEARIAGTLIHRWIQFCTDRDLDPRDLGDDSLRSTNRRWLHEMGITDAAMPKILERVEAAMRTLGDDERGRWLLSGRGHAELALTGLVSGRVESVVLDRVRIDEAGVHWIVDYKTSTHEGGDLAGFLAAESDRYRPQLARYAEIYRNYSDAAVRCALYFPLLQEFVEVDVPSN